MAKTHYWRPTREPSPALQRTKQAKAAPVRADSLRRLAPDVVQRKLTTPQLLRPADLMVLQRTFGNRAVGALLGRQPIQTKLIVNAPGDQYEREADRVADAVMRDPAMPCEATPGPEQSPVVMTKLASDHGDDGSFTASEDFTQRLQASQGQGRPLPPAFRATFETKMAADFRGVRIHSDAEAGQLSQVIQAEAFTRGSDIFLGAGRSVADTTAGRRLLAHELTHVVQQGAAPPITAAAPHLIARPAAAGSKLGNQVQRKLDWQNTKWEQAKEVWASEGGGRGVLFVTDKPDDQATDPVVVKSGENAPAEVLLAANLHRETKLGKWTVIAPGVRVAGRDERARIKSSLEGKISKTKIAKSSSLNLHDRAQKIIGDVDLPGTIVSQYAGSKDFKTLTEEFQDRPLDIKSPLRLFADQKFVKSLGFLTAIDIFRGNPDRLNLNYSDQNFKIDIDRKIITLLDNVQTNDRFAFQKFVEDKRVITAEDSYDTWRQYKITEELAAGNFDKLSGEILEVIQHGITSRLKSAGSSKLDELNKMFSQEPDKEFKDVRKWFAEGLKKGKKSLLKMSPKKITKGMDNQDELAIWIQARIDHLKNPPAD